VSISPLDEKPYTSSIDDRYNTKSRRTWWCVGVVVVAAVVAVAVVASSFLPSFSF